jgi:hypothetical protein
VNNNDERDYEEEKFNKELAEAIDGDIKYYAEKDQERFEEIDDGPRHWMYTKEQPLSHGELLQRDKESEADSVVRNSDGLQEFIFTFGVGHKLVAVLPESHQPVEPQEGFSLAGYYVRISAPDEFAARMVMISRWGHNWSSCYYVIDPIGQNAINKYKELKFE